jgi:hypothetical protein
MRAIAAALLATASLATAAATFPVDDSQSLPREANVPMSWRSLAPNRAVGNAVDGSMIITLRLNTAPWMNRVGKIYMTLPEQAIGEVDAEWTTQGKLLPGKIISGTRTLVYAGPIKTNVIEDTIVLKISADGRRLSSAQRLQFNFEIDVE